MKHLSERRFLQIAVFVFGWVPVLAGLGGMIQGAAFVQDGVAVSLDSHIRYLSGILCAIGFCFWAIIPAIENMGFQFRLLTLLVFVGGLGRLAGVMLMGWPSSAMIFGLVMELAVTPLLCLWQGRVARLKGGDDSRSVSA